MNAVAAHPQARRLAKALLAQSSAVSRIPRPPSRRASNAAPKFPVPPYGGASRPMPTVTISSSNSQQDSASMERYQHEIANAIRPSYDSQTPLLMRNMLNDCDAIYFWQSLEYWRVAVGEHTPVEVEVGKSYNRGKRAPLRFGDYLDYLALSIEQEDKEQEQMQAGMEVQEQQAVEQEVAYLAQTELFPQVLNDIPIPSFCEKDGYNVGEGKLYHTMLWMGPRHTVSPLHFDPMDNLLMQVVGWKRVLLFPADDTADDAEGNEIDPRSGGNGSTTWWHYAGAEDNQYNTSAIDVENPDYRRFPHFRAAPTPYECVLGPGDTLYIPRRWWHHVRSLEMSVSANVWWR